GVPAVVTKVGAIFEIMRDRETGFMVDEGDAPGLAEALEEVLTNESLRRIVAKNATNFVGETFDAARTTGRIEEIIKQVLVKHAARPQKP
ncbi:MAG: glycosyltransferase, partial [Proteobacteria bacterium]|nr:glycosyltransferase [Pseudomonadota bacterium]